MRALRGCYILLRSLNSWRTIQTTCLSFRCCHTRSVPSRHGAVFFFDPITARRGLLSSQDQCKHLLSCYRQLSTSSKNSCSHIGKIESTHYHLIYTCKVRYVYHQYTAVCTKNEISLQVAQHFWGFNFVFIFLICNYVCVCVFRAGLLY